MIIKRIVLRNFKNHANSEYTFEKGVNLILGKNGVGKSSIFEAIGLALFDVKNKDYDEFLLRRNDEASEQFFVSVQFVGNDGIEYVVERTYNRKLKKSEVTLKHKNGMVLLDKSSKIAKKINELTGIPEDNGKDIFKNVLCAYQNDIFNVFKSDSENSKFFNRIFEADVYDQIFKQFITVENKYENKEENLTELEKFAEEELKKYEGIEEELSKKIKSLKHLNTEISSKSIQLEEYKKQRNFIIKNIEELEKLISQKQSLEKEIEIFEKELVQLESEIELGTTALKVVENTYQLYKIYIEASEKLKIEKANLNKLQEQYKEKQKIEKNRDHIANEIEKINIEIISKENSIKRINLSLKTKLELLDSSKSEMENTATQLNNVKKTLEIIEKELDLINNHYIEYIEKSARAKELNLDLKDLTNTENMMASISNEIESLKKDNAYIRESIIKEIKLEREHERIEQQLSKLQETLERLSDGICPILKEQCLNIAQKGGMQVFINREKLEAEKLRQEVLAIENEIQKILQLKGKLLETEKLLNDKYNILSKTQHRLEELRAKREQLNKLENFLEDLEKKFGNIEDKKSQVEREYNQAMVLREKLTAKLENIKEQIKNVEVEIENLEEITEKENANIEQLSKKNEQLEKSKAELQKKLEEFENLTEKIETTQEKLEKLENDLERYKLFYEQYLSNLRMAENLKKIIKRKDELNNKISEKKKELGKQPFLIHIQKDTNTMKIEKIQIEEAIETISKELLHLIAAREVVKKEIENLEANLMAKKEKLTYIETLKKEKEHVRLKKQLTQEFRSKVKLMGPQVTQQLTHAISQEATKVYRRISGKDEILSIENTNGKYIFNLSDKSKGTRNFSLLSGGEQVSMAIAFRIALTKILTKADMYILDEPTINLDGERRLLLAENLKHLLSNLSQAFIITHDEEFLDKGYNEIVIAENQLILNPLSTSSN